MRVLQEVLKSYDSIGIDPKLEPFNRKVLRYLAVYFLGMTLLLIYLFHEADTSREYMESIYVVTSCSGILLSAASTIFIREKLFLYIDTLNKRFDESKS